MKTTYQANEIESVAKQIIKSLSTKTLIIYGNMGAGKTTLIKSLVKEIGSNDEVTSPTFSIVNEYKANANLIFHFDLYRINSLEEAYNFGVEDYLYSNNWCIIEWPELIESILPENFDKIEIKINQDNTRTLELNK